jgi:amino acid adenylation domain-containing protein
MSTADRVTQEFFEEQVRKNPAAVALMCQDESMSYGELNRRANQLAHLLRSRGVAPDQLVGLCIDRGLELVVALLAVLKSGGACVLLDPRYPPERLQYLVRDANPRVMLTQERLRELAASPGAAVLTLEGISAELAGQADTNPASRESGLSSRHLAYVSYTSGSTGVPKGVAAEHRGLVNRILASAAIEAFSGDDICCHKTNVAFVDAYFEILGPLSTGLPLVIARADEIGDVEELADLLQRWRITRLITVPALAEALLENDRGNGGLASLRTWTLSGEEVGADLLRRLQELLPGCEFLNLYGTSEVAADATFYASRQFTGQRVPIGRPIRNVQVYVLDPSLRPVPIGVSGEIYVAGHGLARGYLNRPAWTAERFMPNPYGPPGSRLYRTGDLGRWTADGNVEYLGRRDFQVKIRGFRIELGEIESRLLQYPGIRAALLTHEVGPRGGYLVAYYVERSSGDDVGPGVDADARTDSNIRLDIDARGLREYLSASLPEHMVPAAYVRLERLPLTPNGKVDRRALPTPDADSFAKRDHEPPSGPVETRIAAIWAELLGVERVGRHDNFFELGGHSLLAVHMISLVREALDTKVALPQLFGRPILSDFAGLLSRGDSPQDPQPALQRYV